jgi:hypothetical protein
MRLIVLVFLSVFTVPAFAQQPEPALPEAPQPVAPQRDVRWDAVEELVPGESIELRDRANGVRTPCLLDYVNDAALACRVADSGRSFRRVVYPHAGIDRVWVTRLVPEPNWKLMGIFAGVGAAAGGLLLSETNKSGITLGVLMGGALGAGSMAKADMHLSTRRRLVYVAP